MATAVTQAEDRTQQVSHTTTIPPQIAGFCNLRCCSRMAYGDKTKNIYKYIFVFFSFSFLFVFLFTVCNHKAVLVDEI